MADTKEHTHHTSAEQRKIVEEHWKDIRSALKSKWSVLSDNDLSMIDGDSRKLVALVHQKTQLPIHEIEEGIDAIASTSEGLLSRIYRSTSEFLSESGAQVSEFTSATARQVSEPVSRVAKQARTLVVARPMPSIGVVFGVGLLVGLLATRLTMED